MMRRVSPALFGISIQHYLEEHDILQKELAERLHLSECVMSRKLRNINRITLAEYVAICAALDVPADTFLPDTQSDETRQTFKHPCEEVSR